MFLYFMLTRKWEYDQAEITKLLDYFADQGYPLQIMLFPEGTNLSENTRQKSHAYADSVGAPHTDYVLLPRVTGFVYLVRVAEIAFCWEHCVADTVDRRNGFAATSARFKTSLLATPIALPKTPQACSQANCHITCIFMSSK